MPPHRSNEHRNVERKIIMAVDFGTAFSGLAWAQTRKPEIQSPVIQWPDATSGGLEGATSDKVPTELQYDSQGYKWGFQIGDFGQRHQFFKLGLDPSQSRNTSDLARQYPDLHAAPPAYVHGPEELVKDYMTALRSHAECILRHKLPQSALNSTPVEFVVTVPAVWSDGAQAATRRCAERAGMGVGARLHMISEPEAAAMYALDAMDPHNIEVGDTFVLLDAGGGTVDLISYKVSALKPALCIAEAAPGSGSLCGSTFLNRIFHEFLENKFKKDPNWDEDVLEEAMKRFEVTVKRSFAGNPNDEFLIPVPGLKDSVINGVRRGRLRLTGSDVRAIFEPVIKEIIVLVNGQIDATKAQVTAVLMVGGFSQNVYLRDRIRQAVAKRGIEVMQSPNGWTAVVRGALMKGLASTNSNFTAVNIRGRSARKSYGIAMGVPFRESEHDTDRRYWDLFEGRYLIQAMAWFIRKGETVEENKPKRINYYISPRANQPPPSTHLCVIYMCAAHGNTSPPIYRNTQLKALVEVSADLSRIPVRKIPKATGADGHVYYKLSFDLEVTHYSAFTQYELIHDGINYGPIAAEYV
ncbi:MAG: hypothetical protein Q9179_000691 [Wetmoreana sp. 5 TL-2023]